MTNTLIGVWLVLFGTLSLVQTKVPDWIVPVSAVVVGLLVIAGGGWLKKQNP